MLELFLVLIKIVIAVVATLGLTIKSGILKKEPRNDLFLFFTNLTALLCALFYFYDAFLVGFGLGENSVALNVKAAIVVYSFVVFAIYNFVLVPMHRGSNAVQGIYSFSDVLIHCAMPVLILADWALFTVKGAIAFASPFLWLVFPGLYIVVIVLRAKCKFGPKIAYLDSYYPYFFIDAEKIGMKKTVLNSIVLAFIFVILGLVLWIVDKVL